MFPQNEALPFLTTDVQNCSVELVDDYFTGLIEYTCMLFYGRQFSSCAVCLFYFIFLLQKPEIHNLTSCFGCFLYIK